MTKRDFLFELGTEELPPKSLFTLARALAEGIQKGLAAAAITHGELEWFATPRRLAVRVHAMADRQPDQEIKRQGPAVANAFDAAGQPTKAASGFAASCGVSVEELQ
ncbi:MAG TPA: glycine--tRNA ligase subunit beta, partial [Burkholderiales bacterium]|nr:glycine--tRNA ligase subunit beta [Burkholderiales bacterium]